MVPQLSEKSTQEKSKHTENKNTFEKVAHPKHGFLHKTKT